MLCPTDYSSRLPPFAKSPVDRAAVKINSDSICGLREAHKKGSSLERLGHGEEDASGQDAGWRASERVTRRRDGMKLGSSSSARCPTLISGPLCLTLFRIMTVPLILSSIVFCVMVTFTLCLPK